MYANQFKENMYSLFLPIFMAIFIAVPVAVATSFFLLKADRANAETNQFGNTSVTASGVACVEPAGSSASAGSHSHVAAALLGLPSTGDVTNNNTENYSYVYDSYNTGSYNSTNTQTWYDNDTNTQSWEDNDNTVYDNSNQGNPVTNTVLTVVLSNTQSWEDNDSNTQTFEDNDSNTQTFEDNDTTVVAPQDNDTTVTTTTVEDNDGVDIF